MGQQAISTPRFSSGKSELKFFRNRTKISGKSKGGLRDSRQDNLTAVTRARASQASGPLETLASDETLAFSRREGGARRSRRRGTTACVPRERTRIELAFGDQHWHNDDTQRERERDREGAMSQV